MDPAAGKNHEHNMTLLYLIEQHLSFIGDNILLHWSERKRKH